MNNMTANHIAVSIIIPIYNVENYLEQCLSSIVNQTFKNIEIILLNDGSTDGSLEICKKFQAVDNRIKLYTHKNRGLGETRNRGIGVAAGEFIFFADSDDYLACDYVEALYNVAIATGADVVQGESKTIWEDGKEEKRGDLSNQKDILTEQSGLDVFFRDIFFPHVYTYSAWSKLYKTSFVKEHGLLFGDNKRVFGEDIWFQLQLLHYNPHIAFDSGSYYYYRQRSTSIMHTAKKKLLSRQAAMIEDYASLLKYDNGTEAEIRACGMVSMEVFILEVLNQINVRGNFKSYRNAVRHLRMHLAIYHSICGFNQNKAYTLETNSWRRKFLRIVSFLYRCKLDLLAQLVVWYTYKVTMGSENGMKVSRKEA